MVPLGGCADQADPCGCDLRWVAYHPGRRHRGVSVPAARLGRCDSWRSAFPGRVC